MARGYQAVDHHKLTVLPAYDQVVVPTKIPVVDFDMVQLYLRDVRVRSGYCLLLKTRLISTY